MTGGRLRGPGRAAGRRPRDRGDEGPAVEEAAGALEGRFAGATLITVQNGLGAEPVVRAHGDWPLVSGVTFMSGTRHDDTHVEYILDTETWLGPYEGTTAGEARRSPHLLQAPA